MDGSDKDALIQRRVLFGTISNYIGKLVPLAAGFFLTPFILFHLGQVTYGIWALVGSVVQYGALLDLGISTAVIKYVAEFRAKGEMDTAHDLVSTALWLYSGLGLAAVLLSLAVAPWFADLFNVPKADKQTLATLVVLMGVTTAIALPCTTPTAVLRGLHRFDLTNIVAVSATLISVSATIVVLLLGGGILGMVAIGIPLTLLMQIPTVVFIRRVAPDLHLAWGRPSRRLARMLLGYSASTFVIEIGGQLQSRTDTIIVGVLLPVAEVTPYSFAQRLSTIPQILTDQFMKVLLPLASELHAHNDRDRLRGLYISGTRLALATFLPVGCAIVLLAGPILTLWVGATYARYSYLVIILTAAVVIDTALWPAGSVLQGMARQRPLAVMTTLSAVTNLVLSIVLVQRIGLAGVAVGTLIPTSIEAVFVFAFVSRTLDVSPVRILDEILWPVILPLVPAAAALVLYRVLIPDRGIIALAAVTCVEALIYVLVYARYGASKAERRAYSETAHRIIQHVKVWT